MLQCTKVNVTEMSPVVASDTVVPEVEFAVVYVMVQEKTGSVVPSSCVKISEKVKPSTLMSDMLAYEKAMSLVAFGMGLWKSEKTSDGCLIANCFEYYRLDLQTNVEQSREMDFAVFLSFLRTDILPY